MMTLLASLLGFITSAIPKGMEIYQDIQDKKHEVELFKLQIDAMTISHSQRVEEIAIESDVEQNKNIYKTFYSNVKWIDGLNALIRPILALSFFSLYTYVKYTQFTYIGDAGLPLSVYLDILWTVEDQSIFASVIAFYFGNRTFDKLWSRKKSN